MKERKFFWRGPSLWLGLLISLFCFSCASGGRLSRNDFCYLTVGTLIQQVIQKYGQPIRIHSKEPGVEVYEYVECISTGNDLLEQRNYFLVVRDGIVVEKYQKKFRPLPFQNLSSETPYPVY